MRLTRSRRAAILRLKETPLNIVHRLKIRSGQIGY